MKYLVDHDISLVKLWFGVIALGVFILSILVNVINKYLPKVFVDMYHYGKFVGEKSSWYIVMVPKSWFRHFYVVGVICTGTVMMIMISVCYFGKLPPTSLLSLLNAVTSNTRSPGTGVSAMLGITLLFAHCVARLVETHFISIFSRSSMNIAHYVCGIVHYFGAAVAIAAESPGFANFALCSPSFEELTVFDCCGVFLFCLASYEQLKSSIILANLRKNKSGTVYTLKHSIPRGRFFEVLSSPHISAEIIIYVALTIILRSNHTWWYIFVWVLINQCSVSWTNHKWYQENFPSYPKVRKALIPYVF